MLQGMLGIASSLQETPKALWRDQHSLRANILFSLGQVASSGDS